MSTDKSKISGVYFIRNTITGNHYIGSSSDVNRRLRDHFNALRGGYHHNAYLSRAFKKYGEDAFECGLCDVVEIEDLLVTEQWWLDHVGVMNIAPKAGSTRGWKASPETRAKLSAMRTGERNAMFGKKRPDIMAMLRTLNTGRKLTEEHKRKCSEALTGQKRNWSTEAKARVIAAIKKANTGRVLSPERRQQIAESMRGRVFTQEHKDKIRAANTGKRHTEATKEKIAAGKRGLSLDLCALERERRRQVALKINSSRTPEERARIAQKSAATRKARKQNPGP